MRVMVHNRTHRGGDVVDQFSGWTRSLVPCCPDTCESWDQARGLQTKRSSRADRRRAHIVCSIDHSYRCRSLPRSNEGRGTDKSRGAGIAHEHSGVGLAHDPLTVRPWPQVGDDHVEGTEGGANKLPTEGGREWATIDSCKN